MRPLLLALVLACHSNDPLPDDTSAPLGCEGDDGDSVSMVVAPYLQSVSATEAWVLWETDTGDGSRVDFGDTLERFACGALVPVTPGTDAAATDGRVHEVHLTGLEPGTTYSYRVRTGATSSEPLALHTPTTDPEAPVRLVAVGDTQRDSHRPDTWREIAQDGIMAYLSANHPGELAESLDGVLVTGDLVQSGWQREQWRDDFFPGSAPLFGRVPAYPILGNHDGSSPMYFQRFHLPQSGLDERYYWFDRSNLRIIGLDSNPPFADDAQLAWLETTLDDACANDAIDFVILQLHHPFLSELWPHGESAWTGKVIERLDSFANRCGKPAVHLYGHTHGYSRGASIDAPHLWVNVSTGGGAIDAWGDPDQRDYAQVAVTQATWGFVLLESQAGDAPTLHILRISRGDSANPEDNAVTDSVTLRRYNTQPATPTLTPPEPCAEPRLTASPFVDPDGQSHAATQWQAAATCDDFSAPVIERLRQDRNEWGGQDLQAGDDLTDEVFSELTPSATLCWRLRYRDASLAWSDWSTPLLVPVAACAR